ncbi:MAG: hypothetical protein ABI468_07960, partial [Candidatus Nanopelagicales bacterium]
MGHDPTTATFLPDWSEYWITTTREQAGGSAHPYHPADPTQPADPTDLAQSLVPGLGPEAVEPDPADTRAPSSYITVDLTPANVAPADFPAADVPAADVALADFPPAAPVDVPAGDHAQLHPDVIARAPSDLVAIDATADEPSPTDHELADHGTTQLQVPYSDGQNPGSDDVAHAWGDDGSVLDQPGAAHLAEPNSGVLQGLPPPVA